MTTQVQQTIIDQMGGNKFRVMVGCKRMIVDGEKPAVTFEIGSGANKRIRFVKVELMADDTYTMSFSKIYKHEHKLIISHGGIYCDGLKKVFEKETGFYTSL